MASLAEELINKRLVVDLDAENLGGRSSEGTTELHDGGSTRMTDEQSKEFRAICEKYFKDLSKELEDKGLKFSAHEGDYYANIECR